MKFLSLFFPQFSGRILIIRKIMSNKKIGYFTHTKKNVEDFNDDPIFNELIKKVGKDRVVLLNTYYLDLVFSFDERSFIFDGQVFNHEEYDLVIVRNAMFELKASLLFLKYCKEKGINVMDNNLTSTGYAINKKFDYFEFSKNKLPIPKTYFFRSIENLDKFLDREGEALFPLVMKPINAGQGMHVRLVHSREEIYEKIANEFENKLKVIMFQEFIDYVADLRVFVLGGKVIGCMRRIPAEGDWRANFSLGGTVEKYEATSEIVELALAAANSVNLELGGIDILVLKDGSILLLEANRTPGVEGISEAMNDNISLKYLEYTLEKFHIR